MENNPVVEEKKQVTTAPAPVADKACFKKKKEVSGTSNQIGSIIHIPSDELITVEIKDNYFGPISKSRPQQSQLNSFSGANTNTPLFNQQEIVNPTILSQQASVDNQKNFFDTPSTQDTNAQNSAPPFAQNQAQTPLNQPVINPRA
jgi:hypothetical protein